ncbi:hypothetical protein ACELLULO517_07785 [Acidisoma cellulosilytica]|uniref:Uncharacterized protein n=1 Tax=Acidisoma cellulosilyticum TaxID=2802395 RepID=A0A963YZM1_9PROT|nr:hypothetical protein [Acidisoma cellulosilyticum]MCB8880132.1 hypothetical protein [Acidisoma cellulosilyticum]
MPLQQLKIRPGINTQLPPILNEGGWSQSQLIRFENGQPQAIGGWVKWWETELDSPARAIRSWADFNGTVWTAVGTDTSVYVIGDGQQLNITPIINTTNPTVDFSTVEGSTTVTILDNAVGVLNGTAVNIVTPVAVGGIVLQGLYQITMLNFDSFTITSSSSATSTVIDGGIVPSFTTMSGSLTVTVTLENHGYAAQETFGVTVPVTVGGLTLNGAYLIESVVDDNTFTISAVSAATSSATALMNGGNARFVYYNANQSTYVSYGYGIGGYGLGGYGEGSIYVPPAVTQVPLWTFDTWGETLILCQGGGPIFTWTPESGQTQAQLIAGAPPINGGIFVAMPELTLVAWGSSTSGIQEPLLVQWSTIGDYTNWIPTVENQAGSQTIPSGSRVVGAIQGPQQALIFTDVDVYSMNYLGGSGEASLAWGFIKLADHCGLIATRAVCVLDETVFWIAGPSGLQDSQGPSGGRFMVYNGGVTEPLPCTVYDTIFQDLDWANSEKIVAASNALFHEVSWFYPSLSGGSGECDSYVKFNKKESTWDFGKLPRCGWQDYSAAGNPIGGGSDGYLYAHEVGITADGADLNWSVASGAVMIAEGDMMMFVDWLLPEFYWGIRGTPTTVSPVTLTISGYRFSNDVAPVTQSSMTFTQSGSGFSNPRVRGRNLSFTFGGPGFARLGSIRYRAAPDGKY